MTSPRPALRRVVPWLIGWAAFQSTVAVVGLVAARRLSRGDERSTRIHRVLTHGGLELHPVNPLLTTVGLDIALAGAEIDLSSMGRPATAVDLTVRAVMSGVAVRVPADWRVWWRFRGVGGIGSDHGVARATDEHSADLRVHATVLLGGIAVEAAGPDGTAAAAALGVG